MAQVTRVELVDDLTGDALAHDDAETVRFGLDGVGYEIDLSKHNAGVLRDVLGDYTQRARTVVSRDTPRVGRRKASGSRVGEKPQVGREQIKAAREWLLKNGYAVSERGRIKAELMEIFTSHHAAPHAAHEQVHPTHGHVAQEHYEHAMAV